jgi:anti-anti-sigma factor
VTTNVEAENAQDLHIEIADHEDVTIVALAGELTVFTGKLVRETVMKLISNKRFNIIFDLARVEYIDSTGVGCLTATLKEVYNCGGDLKLARLSRFVKRVFDVLHIDYFIDCYERVEDAAADFRSNLAKAIFKWQKLIEMRPNYADAYNNLAIAYKASGMLGEARIELEKAVQINPAYLDAYNNLGRLAISEGKLEEATERFKKVLEKDPENLEALKNLAFIYDDANMLDEAVKRYRGAISLYPNYADLHFHLGKVYLKKGDLDGAIMSLEEACRLNSCYLDACRALADVYIEKGDDRRALAWLKRVTEISMNETEIAGTREKIRILHARGEEDSMSGTA